MAQHELFQSARAKYSSGLGELRTTSACLKYDLKAARGKVPSVAIIPTARWRTRTSIKHGWSANMARLFTHRFIRTAVQSPIKLLSSIPNEGLRVAFPPVAIKEEAIV